MKVFPIIPKFNNIQFGTSHIVSNPNTQALQNQPYNIVDVFSYNVEKNKIGVVNKKISGKNFGDNYQLEIARPSPSSITGNIGGKQVDIKLQKNGNNWDISGNVGNKQVKLQVLSRRHLKGKFGNEDIEAHSVMTRHGMYVDGKNIKLTKELVYGSGFWANFVEKCTGKFNLDKDFLPVIVAITDTGIM